MSRRTAICRLASRRRVTLGKRRRGVTSDSSVARLRPSRLGSSRGWRVGRTAPRPGSLPKSEQERRQRAEIRQVRSSSVGNQRDAPGGRCHPRQHLPDRVATAEETILTEDRAARQALQTILPHRQDQGGRRERFRVEPADNYFRNGNFFATSLAPKGSWYRVK